MLIEDVAKLSPMNRFLYWIKERHKIHKKRQAGKPKPWTNDVVLQSYFFTNPYRENDKTTIWFRENIREPLRNNPSVIFVTVAFRWFNRIETGQLLWDNNLLVKWNSNDVVSLLGKVRAKGDKVFTGAFMIPAVPGTKKIEHVCDCLQLVWDTKDELTEVIVGGTLQNAHEELIRYPWLGGFMAYEIVTDLRYTYVLERARDKLKWCNPGPGCARGLQRLNGVSQKGIPAAHGATPPKDWLKQMQQLYKLVSRELKDMPRIEMREIEHSLCEWDKYERGRLGDGKMKRRYKGV